MTAHKVTQADRELFKLLYGCNDPETAVHVDAGKFDEGRRMQAIAAHRIAVEQSRDDVMIAICEAEAAKILHNSEGINGRRSARVADQIADAIRAMKDSKT